MAVRQFFKIGEVIEKGNSKFECIHISVQTDDNDEPTSYSYEFRLQSEMDALRKANEADADKLAAEAADRAESEDDSETPAE